MKTPPSLVFISYPRNPDIHFVERLAIALHNEHFETWVDSHSIQYGEEFLKAIERGIQRAVAVVYLVSPEAIDSKYCNVELNLALTFGKRIIPILRRPTTDIPAPIEGIHRLEVLKDSELDSKLPDLLSDLQTDQEWERLHNRLLDKALDYKATPKDHRHELLLSSYELDRAQKWRQSADPRDAKRIVPAIRLFLSESRKQVDRNDRDFARIAQALSNEFKFGSRDWDNVTQEISERPWVEHTKILSIVVDDAIRDGGGRLGDHFYYLLGDLPRALKLQKSDWARIIFRIFSNEWFRYSAVPSMIAESTFTFPAFFAACDLAANEGQLIAPVSLPVRIARESLLELPGDFTREN